MIDEGPSEEDLARFGDDQVAYCPQCGEEVYDDAIRCPACGSWIANAAERRPPLEREARQRMIAIVVVLVLLGFTGVVWLLSR